MPRPLWSGSIVFGLVNAPVRVYSAIGEHKLHFQLLHTKDDGAIGYRKVCKLEDKAVPDDEIAKAFEVAKGEYVYLDDEDFEAARAGGSRAIEIADFVPYEDIDPIFFATTYYVGPADGAERPYALLARAMADSGLAAVAKFVMRDRQHLGLLRVRDGVILLEQLHFADEIRPVDEIAPSKGRVDKRELELAARLIGSFKAKWDPARYRDTYRDELMAVIDAKRKGEDVHATRKAADGEETPDLMSALRASIGRSRVRNLDSLSKQELEERARKAKVPGRSKMSKLELADALRRAA